MPNENGATPGDATSAPFGDGRGSMATARGNNFVTNPAGGNPGSRGNNFVTNPGGNAAGGPGTPMVAAASGSRPQQSGTDPVSTGDAAAGPPDAAQVATPGPEQVSRRDIGTVAGQAVHKPFRVSGG